MSNFWRHVSSVFTGALVAQLIPIVGSIFIARIFAPNHFGEFSAWLAIVAFLSVILTLRFETMLAIAKDGLDRLRAVFFIFTVTGVTAILLFLITLGLKFLPGAKEYLPKSQVLLLMLVPAAFFLALNQVWQTWAAAEGNYGKLNAMRLVQASILVLVQIGAGLKYPTATSLALGVFVAGGLGFAWSVKLMPGFVRGQFCNFSQFRNFFFRYKKFPLYALPADAINTAAGQLPILIISYRFGSEVAGYLALTMRVLGAPIGLVGKAVLDVFKRYAIQDLQATGNCRQLYVSTFSALSLASLVLVGGTIFLAEDIFYFAFGAEWVPSGRMAIWLLPMFALRMVASPLSYVAYLVERQHIDLIWQSGLMVVTIVTLYAFSTYRSTLIVYGLGYAFMYILYIMMSYRLSKGSK